VAGATVRCSCDCLLPFRGIAFLSEVNRVTGIGPLNAMNIRFKSDSPGRLAFSFARPFQQPALEICEQGKQRACGQKALYHRDKVQPGCAAAASTMPRWKTA